MPSVLCTLLNSAAHIQPTLRPIRCRIVQLSCPHQALLPLRNLQHPTFPCAPSKLARSYRAMEALIASFCGVCSTPLHKATNLAAPVCFPTCSYRAKKQRRIAANSVARIQPNLFVFSHFARSYRAKKLRRSFQKKVRYECRKVSSSLFSLACGCCYQPADMFTSPEGPLRVPQGERCSFLSVDECQGAGVCSDQYC